MPARPPEPDPAGPARESVTARRKTPVLERVLHHASLAAVTVSGVAYAWMKYLVEPAPDTFSVVNHPLQPLALHLHVLAAPVSILALGMILRSHILAGIRGDRGRKGLVSGWVLAGLLVPMIASGYLLQTVVSQGWRAALVWVHLLSGGIYLFGYLLHTVANWPRLWPGASPGIARQRVIATEEGE